MSKLEDAARALLADYDRTMSLFDSDHRDPVFPFEDDWPELRALRAALSEREAEEMQQVLAEQVSRPRGISVTDRKAAPTREMSEEEIVAEVVRAGFPSGNMFAYRLARAIERKVRR